MTAEQLIAALSLLNPETEILVLCQEHKPGIVLTTDKFKFRVLKESKDKILLSPAEGPWAGKEFVALSMEEIKEASGGKETGSESLGRGVGGEGGAHRGNPPDGE